MEVPGRIDVDVASVQCVHCSFTQQTELPLTKEGKHTSHFGLSSVKQLGCMFLAILL